MKWQEVQNLPEGSVIDLCKTYLHLCYSPITRLPDGLTVIGSLDLFASKLESLPDNLRVTGSIDIRGTKITELPLTLECAWIDVGPGQINDKSKTFAILAGIDIVEWPPL